MADLETKNSAVATEESGERKVKMRSLALDLVPMGSDEENRMADLKVNKTLPEGIESKMLYSDIIHIAWPSLVELTLTQLASMVDLMMVGQLGPWALTAVGLTTQPKFLLMTMFMAMNVGATAMVARYKGAGNQKKADEVLRQALLMTFVLGCVFAVIGFIAAPWLIKFMGASEDHVLRGGVDYLRIQMIGLPGLALTSTITATLRGVGNSKTAMIYNAMANIINVIFNYMLIYGNFGAPRMEVAGASLATIIGQYCAMFMAFYAVMNGQQYIILRFRDGFKPNKEEIKKIVDIGAPAMVEQVVMRIGLIIYTRTVAGLGTLPYAVHQVCLNIQEKIASIAKPGIPCETLYNTAIEMVTAAGFADKFMGTQQQAKFIGHGIGLEINEAPVLAPRMKQELEPGMVFALEPKIVLPGIGPVGIENSWVVTNERIEKLTNCNEEIIELK